jgi:hypothetical protein
VEGRYREPKLHYYEDEEDDDDDSDYVGSLGRLKVGEDDDDAYTYETWDSVPRTISSLPRNSSRRGDVTRAPRYPRVNSNWYYLYPWVDQFINQRLQLKLLLPSGPLVRFSLVVATGGMEVFFKQQIPEQFLDPESGNAIFKDAFGQPKYPATHVKTVAEKGVVRSLRKHSGDKVFITQSIPLPFRVEEQMTDVEGHKGQLFVEYPCSTRIAFCELMGVRDNYHELDAEEKELHQVGDNERQPAAVPNRRNSNLQSRINTSNINVYDPPDVQTVASMEEEGDAWEGYEGYDPSNEGQVVVHSSTNKRRAVVQGTPET